MERLKLMFPTLARWPSEKLALLPLGVIWLVLVFAAWLHLLIWPGDLPDVL